MFNPDEYPIYKVDDEGKIEKITFEMDYNKQLQPTKDMEIEYETDKIIASLCVICDKEQGKCLGHINEVDLGYPSNTNESLTVAAGNGDLHNVKILLQFVKKNIGRLALLPACKNNRKQIVDYILETCNLDKNDLSHGLSGACNNGSKFNYSDERILLIDLMIRKGAKNIGNYFRCPNNEREVIRLMEIGTIDPKQDLKTIASIGSVYKKIKLRKQKTIVVLKDILLMDLISIVNTYTLL